MLSLYDRVNQASVAIRDAGAMTGVARCGSELGTPSTATHLLFVLEEPIYDGGRYQDTGRQVTAETRSR